MKLALSILCENPDRRTGLTTLFHEFVRHALVEKPELKWVVFAGPRQEWKIADSRVEVVREFPSNERRMARLWADHFRVAPEARRRGAECLLTVGFVPLRTAKLPVAMHVFAVHHLRPGGGAQAFYRRIAIERGRRRAALVITNSQWTASQLGPTKAPMLVSYEGLQHESFSPSGPKSLAGWPETYLLWIGNFYGYKRAGLALSAYARLPDELRARFPLMMVGGEWNGGRMHAEAAARAMGISANVHFPGWVPDAALPALYRGARAHLLSTAEETFGRTVTEAMACGCPCVLQDLPVLREVAAGAALFVDFTDTAAAGEALRRICSDEALCAGLRAKGIRRATDFDFAKLTSERIGAILAAVGTSQ